MSSNMAWGANLAHLLCPPLLNDYLSPLIMVNSDSEYTTGELDKIILY